MEKALILITLKLESSSNLLEQVKAIPSVTDAEMVYGPYDAYVVLEADTKEELRETDAESEYTILHLFINSKKIGIRISSVI